MENKKDLAKIALTALILASATPVTGQADIEAHGIILAAGCPAHGCAQRNGSASNQLNNTNSYNAPASNQNSRNYRGQPYDEANPEYGMAGYNRGNGPQTDYDNNMVSRSTPNAPATLTEAQLLGMLSPQGRAIYLSLNPEGKALAIQLASQDSYRDKTLAVKEAQRRMNERHGANR
jgi:hypothetical protein